MTSFLSRNILDCMSLEIMDENRTIITRILNDFDRSLNILSITRPSDGYSNTVYFIRCSNNQYQIQELVLKFIKPNDLTEISFYERIHQSMIDKFPVPKIIKYDLSSECFYLASKLPGIPLSHSFTTLTNEQQLELYRQFGNLVGQLHAKQTYDQCGYLEGNKFSTWTSMFKSIVEEQTKRFQGTFFEKLAQDIKQYLINHLKWIDQQIIPRLLHMDLHCGNILVENGKITGILDAEDAMIGHNEYELMRIEKGHFEENSPTDQIYREIFMFTYQQHVRLDDDYQKRRPFYSLSRELVGMECLLNYGERYTQNGSIEEEKNKMETNIRKLLAS
jgi:aminoglycoside phosphotransferase (APT) family kinase protein